MPHNHVTVTVEADVVSRIEERLDPGETVADWMRDAVVARLEGESVGERSAGDDRDVPDHDRDGPHHERDAPGDEADEPEGPAYEFVDDCAI